ncbi:MAG: molybdopterin-dependent oxidoreductase, partial [Myxococcales bacterium]|nr:molybdopterin-dependent oxidoreductase [Myxococcales bacterium]
VNDAFPGGVLADEITTPGPGQHRALFVTGGNPLITMPGSDRLRRALGELELCVVLDIQRGETASLAHYVLPCTTPLERPDLPFIFPLLLGMQSRPYLQATEAVAKPDGEQRDEATIYLDLCRASGRPIFGSRIAQTLLDLSRRLEPADASGHRPVPQRRLLDLVLRLGGAPGFARMLADHGHGLRRADNRGGSYLGQRVLTDDGRVDLAPAPLLAAAERLEQAFIAERGDQRRLKLITKRDVTTHNSWTHNHQRFVGRGTNHVYLHPEDAAARGLAEGALADVASEVATVRLPVRLSEDLMPGSVALPHGWGHQGAGGLSVARETSGVNVNLLAADGPGALEPVTGMAHLTAIAVEVRPAAGPQDTTSWSGIDPAASIVAPRGPS